MSFSARWLRAAVCALACLAAIHLARADPGSATDAAFAALLAMPGAQPKEDGWVIPEQALPVPRNEDELIARLQSAQKAGAQWDAKRHRGTLVAHAIRAGKERTAIWLLRNGAKARQILSGENTTAYELARRYERTHVVQELERRYGFKPPTSSAAPSVPLKVQAPAPATTSVPLSRSQQAKALMHKLLPTHVATAQAQQEWQRFAATLSDDEYAQTFEDGEHLSRLMDLNREIVGGVEQALARLPLALVRRHAQLIADALAEWTFVEYSDSKIAYSAFSQSWPALWSRVDQPLHYPAIRSIRQSRMTLEELPPALWPGLFASGYPRGSIRETGCLLGALDAGAFKALWPQLLDWFSDARKEAPGLVLAKYRLSHQRSPCHYSSSTQDTVAKLAYLREQGVTSPVTGVRPSYLQGAGDASLAAMAREYAAPPDTQAPRLVREPLRCTWALTDKWWRAFVENQSVGEGIPAEFVQLMALPGRATCGLFARGVSYPSRPGVLDGFHNGPDRDNWPRCPESPEDGELWVDDSDSPEVRRIRNEPNLRGAVLHWRAVRDVVTGKQYFLDSGDTEVSCAPPLETLPNAYTLQAGSWQLTPVGPEEKAALTDLLRNQCREEAETGSLQCAGIDPHLQSQSDAAAEDPSELTAQSALDKLHQGEVVGIRPMLDALGTERRATYRAAVAARDTRQLRQLIAAGIPYWWTTAEILALAKAELPLAEKRRRVALLFANKAQLAAAMTNDRYSLPKSLLTWLPDEDWGPVLQVIQNAPDIWLDDAGTGLRKDAEQLGRAKLACRMDHAMGFLCGGGVNLN